VSSRILVPRTSPCIESGRYRGYVTPSTLSYISFIAKGR
jgi:hypothetical protein